MSILVDILKSVGRNVKLVSCGRKKPKVPKEMPWEIKTTSLSLNKVTKPVVHTGTF